MSPTVSRLRSVKAVLSNTKYCSIWLSQRQGAILHLRMHEADKIALFS